MKASYLSNADILKYIDSLTLRTLFVRMKILDKNERPIKTIEGRATGGSISINASSAVRRAGNITLVTGENEFEKDAELRNLYEITTIDNLISMNKRVEIEIGLKNTGLKYKEYDTFWIPLGHFLITNASVTHNTQGIQIQAKLTDKMALLNGEVGGAISQAIEISPLTNLANGEKEYSPIYNLIFESVQEIGNIPSNKIIIEDVDLRIPQIASSATVEIVKYPNSKGHIIYEVKTDNNKVYPEGAYHFLIAEPLGYKFEDFTYPGVLAVNANDSVVSILEKIKNQLGNYEYFFDIDGNFRFRQIKNFLNEGSQFDDLTMAIADGYFINTSKDKSLYSFTEGANLITSYTNNPQYSAIKNDYTVWGRKRNTDTPLQYHLLIGNKFLSNEQKHAICNYTFYSAPEQNATNAIMRYYRTFEEALLARNISIDSAEDMTIEKTQIAYRWKFNNELIAASNISIQASFTFIEENKTITASRLDFNISQQTLRYYYIEDGEFYSSVAYKNGVWNENIDKTISFGHAQLLSKIFVEWIKQNAIYQDSYIHGEYEFKSVEPWNTTDFSVEFEQPITYTIEDENEQGIAIICKNNSIQYQTTSAQKPVYKIGMWENYANKKLDFGANDQFVQLEFYNWLMSVTTEITYWYPGVKVFKEHLDWENCPSTYIIDLPFQAYSLNYQEPAAKNYVSYTYTQLQINKEMQTISYYNNYDEKWELVYIKNSWLQRESPYVSNTAAIFINEKTSIALDLWNWLLKQFIPIEQLDSKITIEGVWKIKDHMDLFTFNIDRNKKLKISIPGFFYLLDSNTQNRTNDGYYYNALDLYCGYDQNDILFNDIKTMYHVNQEGWHRDFTLGYVARNRSQWSRGQYKYIYFTNAYSISQRQYAWLQSIATYIGPLGSGNIPAAERMQTFTMLQNNNETSEEFIQIANSTSAATEAIFISDLDKLKEEISWKPTLSELESLDWRSQKYLYAVMTQDDSLLGKEIIQQWPTVFNIKSNSFFTNDPTALTYFLDMIDVHDIEDINLNISESGKKALETASQFSVDNIGYRRKTIIDESVNCMFNVTPDADIFFIPDPDDPTQSLTDQEKAFELQKECEQQGVPYLEVSKKVFENFTSNYGYNSAYDLLRSQLHEFLSYNENINLTTIPVYHLDVNTRITVEDEKSDIHGDYLIQSIQIPLTINGQMTINAKRAIERI